MSAFLALMAYVRIWTANGDLTSYSHRRMALGLVRLRVFMTGLDRWIFRSSQQARNVFFWHYVSYCLYLLGAVGTASWMDLLGMYVCRLGEIGDHLRDLLAGW